MPKGLVIVDKERCKGCGLCIEACPFGVLDFSSEYNASGYRVVHMVHPEKCTGCAVCANVCPDVALEIYREESSVRGAA